MAFMPIEIYRYEALSRLGVYRKVYVVPMSAPVVLDGANQILFDIRRLSSIRILGVHDIANVEAAVRFCYAAFMSDKIEKGETNRTYTFVLQKLHDVEARLVSMIPEMLSLEDFKSIGEISSLIIQIKTKTDEYRSRQEQLEVPAGTFMIQE